MDRQAALSLAAKCVLFSRSIRPVIKFALDQDGVLKKSDIGQFYYIKPDTDIFTECFSWSPVPDTLAENLAVIATINTTHNYAYCLNFKPTVAEVMTFLMFDSYDLAKDASAFSIEFVGSVYEDVHRAQVTLYKSV